MSDMRGQKRHRVPRHGRLSVGTGRHAATRSRAATGTHAPTRADASTWVHHRTGALAATSAHSHAVAGTGSDDRSRVDADPDGATGSPVESYAGPATDTDTHSGAGTSSDAGTGVAGTGEAGGGATGGAASTGGHVRRPNRHRATPWIVAHGGAAAGAVSVAVLGVITAAIVGGGRPVGPAAPGGEWTTVPASSPAPAVPSAGVLFVPLPAASPTTGADVREPGRRAGGRGGRDRAHPGRKRSPGAPDRTPKQQPSPGRPTPDAAATPGPGSATSPP